MSDDPLSVACRHLANSQAIIEAKNAEIEKLKEAIRRLADQDATLSVQNGAVIVTMDATLTPEERAAVALAEDELKDVSPAGARYAATLRSLLDRTK